MLDMTIQNYIEKVIAPKLQGDGGWVEYVSLEGSKLTLIFRGECSKCLILDRCVAWIEGEILSETGENVSITAVRKRPYFQDI